MRPERNSFAEQGFTSSRRPTEDGFTLIELLAAMVAGSLVLATLSWTLTTLGRELRASNDAEARQRLFAAAPVLVRLIEQAQPTAKDEQPIAAESRRLSFVTTPPAALGDAGAVRVELSVRNGAQGESLHARFEDADRRSRLPAAATERALLEDYRSIRFAYELPEEKESGLPPRLVTILLTDRAGRTSRVAAAPRLTSAGDCRFDPISMTCRR